MYWKAAHFKNHHDIHSWKMHCRKGQLLQWCLSKQISTLQCPRCTQWCLLQWMFFRYIVDDWQRIWLQWQTVGYHERFRTPILCLHRWTLLRRRFRYLLHTIYWWSMMASHIAKLGLNRKWTENNFSVLSLEKWI